MAHLEDTAKRWVDLFNKRDLHGLMALYSENCVNAQPHLPQPITGKKATEEDLGAFFAAFPDVRFTNDVIVVSGDTIAIEWTFSGTQTGALAGPGGTLPPSGKRVTIKGGEFIHVDSQGLIDNERGYFDLVSFLTQLGALPQPQAAH